jgi:hypothetical protein
MQSSATETTSRVIYDRKIARIIWHKALRESDYNDILDLQMELLEAGYAPVILDLNTCEAKADEIADLIDYLNSRLPNPRRARWSGNAPLPWKE